MSHTRTVKERLLRGVEIITESGCWVWMKSTNNKGYGRVAYHGKNRLAHRVSYSEFVGSIPKGLCVLHRCDMQPCINPDHLFLGTHQDNTDDKMRKGRASSGSDFVEDGDWICNAKLTKENVKCIKRLLAEGLIYKDIAKRFGVTIGTICNIKTGLTWRHVND